MWLKMLPVGSKGLPVAVLKQAQDAGKWKMGGHYNNNYFPYCYYNFFITSYRVTYK